MWPRHALKLLILLLLLSACSSPDRQAVDELNLLSYAYHYRSLDSTEHFARSAWNRSGHYADGKAEALNNLAFVSIARMRYDEAKQRLDSVAALTDNQIELLIANIQQMRLCQRRSYNREFYDYRELAQAAMHRIEEERATLDERQLRRVNYAESELAIVTSTYYYYVGLEQQSIEALLSIGHLVENDTAQLLNYLYNIGAGGIIVTGTQDEINQQEFDHLMRCYQVSVSHDYPYFTANALEGLAEHLAVADYRRRLADDNPAALQLINPGVDYEQQLPVALATRSLELFQDYGDVYQTSGAWRTLAACYRQLNDYEGALYCLEQALADSAIFQAPDLVASIREQLSVVYAAMGDKPMSDHNRNLYLDLQEQTRQDRSLEARAGQYDQAVGQLNRLLMALRGAIALLLLSLLFFYYSHRRRRKGPRIDQLLQPLNDWNERVRQLHLRQEEQREEMGEQLAVNRQHIETAERVNLEQRAKVSLVDSITPFIDRILYAIDHASQSDDQWMRGYVVELTDKIMEQNEVLTHWIQLRQGDLRLQIETFELSQLFDIVAKGRGSFALKGVDLVVEPTEALVKADRVLTLFMINTLADNARKFTPEGGRVTLKAETGDNYVEIVVSDTGIGMSDEQLAHLFDHQVVDMDRSHGFGLLNCKGIIEKYRKTSQLFSVCDIKAASRLGEGSSIAFRLPRGLRRLAVVLMAFGATLGIGAQRQQHSCLNAASAYADSAYFSNINGNYMRTLLYVDSCRQALNRHYRELCDGATDTLTLMGDPSATPNEVMWLHDSLKTNYGIILDMRNEAAVAALALHQWQLYTYNNRIYTLLFKEMSADTTIADYCRTMQQSQTNKTIAVALLVLVFFAILTAYYLLYYRHRLSYRFCVERVRSMGDVLLSDMPGSEKLERIGALASSRFPEQLRQVVSRIEEALRLSLVEEQRQENDMELAADQLRRSEFEMAGLHVSNAVLDNCLSALKHETMYYPSRIRQLAETGATDRLHEVVCYYRELYAILSEQARRQTEFSKLHIVPLEHELLGDRILIDYLFEILRKQTGQRQLHASYQGKDRLYMDVVVDLTPIRLSDAEAAHLFEPDKDHLPYLLCRQIVREHGEATNRRLCGIWAENTGEKTQIRIILPRQQLCRTSK